MRVEAVASGGLQDAEPRGHSHAIAPLAVVCEKFGVHASRGVGQVLIGGQPLVDEDHQHMLRLVARADTEAERRVNEDHQHGNCSSGSLAGAPPGCKSCKN